MRPGKSRDPVNRGTVNRSFTVSIYSHIVTYVGSHTEYHTHSQPGCVGWLTNVIQSRKLCDVTYVCLQIGDIDSTWAELLIASAILHDS